MKKPKYRLELTLAAIIGLLLLGFAFQCAFMLISAFSSVNETSEHGFYDLSVQKVRTVNARLSDKLNLLTSMTPHFDDARELSEEDIRIKLESCTTGSDFDDIVFIKSDGTAISNYSKGVDLSSREYFIKAMSGVANISMSLTSRFDNDEHNIFASPVQSNGEVIGVLAAKTDELFMDETLSFGNDNYEASLLIITTSGDIVMLSDKNIMGLTAGANLFNDSVFDAKTALSIKNEISNKSISSYRAIEQGEQSLCITMNALGVNDWVLITAVRTDVLQQEYNQIISTCVSCVVAFTCIMVVFLGIIAFIIVRSSRELRRRTEQYEHVVSVDDVTNFASWEKFNKSLGDMLKDYSKNYALVTLDINKFRAVNDFLGHDEGNEILRKLGEIIQRNINEDETFARVVSDVFYCLLTYKDEDDLVTTINNIINDTDYQITEFRLVLSFGIYKICDRNMPVRAMADRADLARRTTKNRNESSYAFFDASMLSKIRQEKAIENIMEQALESGEFKVYLQPKYDLHDRKTIVGAEALVRWKRGNDVISPGSFIPLFEKNRFVLRVDMYVFEEVCKQQKLWINRGLIPKVISVNMSRVHLQDTNFVAKLNEICKRYSVSTKYIEIEITESAAFENLEVLEKVFRELKAYGFKISIDDFGTGYSSLNMLKNLPADVLKIDREFLTGTDKNERAAEIIAHVISLAGSLKMKTICEGIETIEQVELLDSLGCDMAQGFYFARPVPVDEYEKIVYGKKD